MPKFTDVLNLATVGYDPIHYIPVEEWGSCSIEFEMLEGSGFGTGVISIQKTNSIGGPEPIDFSPAQTVGSVGYVELDAADWTKATYLTLRVTTASAGAAKVIAHIDLKKTF